MDFEAFSSSYTDSSPPYSDSSSTPRTPSPRSNDPFPQPINFKHQVEPYPTIIHDSSTHYFHSDQHMIQNDTNWSYPAYPQSGRGSLLQELYDHDAGSEQLYQDVYIDDRAHYNEWQEQQHHHLHVRNTPHDHIARRATFPFVRHDQLAHPSQYFDQYPAMYPESFSVPDPSECHHDPQAIKLEDTPLIVPSQLGFSLHPPPSYLSSSPGTAVAIHHTDDAASKETQYLRRRCFNCHTTEPPSWRRSTLNPGKIVCNKCGLYERTHLRPRPLRFDELRAGGKTRKPAGASQGEKKGSKNAAPAPATTAGVPLVKKEPRELGLIRRGSVSSNASSNGAASDWDDNLSIYSSQPPTPGSVSGQSSAFPSPAVGTFPIPRTSQSPPVEGGVRVPIRLPNAPLTDIASLQQPQQSHPTPRKAATAPGYFSPSAVYQGHVPHNVQFAAESPASIVQGLSPEASPKVQILSPPMTSSPTLIPQLASSS